MDNFTVCTNLRLEKDDLISFLILVLTAFLINFQVVFQLGIPLDEDSLLFFSPLRALHGDMQVGLWDPYLFCGFPRDANPQSQLLYFPNLLFQIMPPFAGFLILLIGHYAIGGLLMYCFLRGIRFSPESALFGSLAFLVSTFWRCKITNLGLLEGISWIPAVLYFYLYGLERKKSMSVLAAVIPFSLVVLAGVPHTVVYVTLAVGILSLSFVLTRRCTFFMALKSFFLLFFGGVFLTAGMWLPALCYAPETQRTSLTLSEALAGSLHWHEIWRVVFGGLAQPDISRSDPWEGTCYIGVTALCFILLGGRKINRTLRMAFTVCAIFALCCTLGREGWIYPFLFQHVPGWDFLNLPNRSLLLLALALPPFAACGFEAFFSYENFSRLKKLALYAITCMTGVIWFLSLFWNHWVWRTMIYSGCTRTFYPDSIPDFVWALLLFCFWTALTGIVLILYIHRKVRYSVLLGILYLLVILQSVQYSQRLFLQTVPASYFDPPRTVKRLQDVTGVEDGVRVCSYAPFIDSGSDVRSFYVKPVFMHRLPELYRLHEIQGYDPMYPARYAELVRRWAGHSKATDPTRTVRLERFPKRLLNLLGVKYVVGYPNQEVLYSGKEGVLDEPGVLGSALDAPKTVSAVSFRWILAGVADAPQGMEVGEVRLSNATDTVERFPIRAGVDIANYILDYSEGQTRHRPAFEYRWFPIPSQNGYTSIRHYMTTYTLSQPAKVDRVSVEYFIPKGRLAVFQINYRTPEIEGWKRIPESTELPIYENEQNVCPAYLTRNVRKYDRIHEIVDVLDHPRENIELPVFFPKEETPALETVPIPLERNSQDTITQYERKISDRIHIEVRTRHDCYLVVSENYSPNWKAEVDGTPTKIMRANHAFMAVMVPAGEHIVTFRYLPQFFYFGCAIGGTLFFLLVLVLGMNPEKWLFT